MTEKYIRIEFLQQNCRKMASVANELHILASQNEATIVCMQEPSFQVKKTQKLTGKYLRSSIMILQSLTVVQYQIGDFKC